MCDLIANGSILALYTDEAEPNYYLFKTNNTSEILETGTTDDWGVTHTMGSNVVRGYYFNQTKNGSLSYKLMDKKCAVIAVASVIYILPTLQCHRGVLKLPETTHLDILSVLDEMEGA